MKDNIKQELIDWQWHNCVPEHQAYRIPQSGVLCADCMLAFVKADRLKRCLTPAAPDSEGRAKNHSIICDDGEAGCERCKIDCRR